MHPILAHREKLALYLATSLIIASLLAVLLVSSGAAGWAEAILFSVPMSILYAFMCLAALYLCRAFPLAETPFVKLAAVSLAASFVSGSLWLLAGRGWTEALALVYTTAALREQYSGQTPILLGIGSLVFLLALVVHYLFLAYETSRESERKALEMQILAREAELKTLRAQFQPHFLFNSLNSISALTSADPSAARTMLLRLAGLLRKNLQLGGKDTITLGEELELVDEYLSIERVRLGDRLRVEKEVAENSRSALIPPLLLQPLFENAVIHGIGSLTDGGTLRLEAQLTENQLKIKLTNPYDPSSPVRQGNGVGIENVKHRLYNACGAGARLDVIKEGERFEVEMRIPLTGGLRTYE